MNVLYAFQKPNILVERDQKILSTKYNVTSNNFKYNKKWQVVLAILRDFSNFIMWRKKKFKLIIVRFGGYHGLIPLLFAKLHKIPSAVIVGGTDAAKLPGIKYGNYRSKLLGLITNINFYLAKNAIFVHESLIEQNYTYDNKEPTKQGVKAFFKGQLKTHTVYNGYDPDLYKPIENTQRKKKSLITAAGSLNSEVMVKRKGVDIIIEAAKLLPEFQFTLIGSTQIPVVFLPLPQNVNLIGFLQTNELIEQFSQHEYYIQASMFEGFPNALAEAMLCGCIPIGSCVSGIPFIIKDTGYILKKRSSSELIKLILSAEASEEKSRKARNRIAQNFTWEMRTRNFLSVISKIADSQ